MLDRAHQSSFISLYCLFCDNPCYKPLLLYHQHIYNRHWKWELLWGPDVSRVVLPVKTGMSWQLSGFGYAMNTVLPLLCSRCTFQSYVAMLLIRHLYSNVTEDNQMSRFLVNQPSLTFNFIMFFAKNNSSINIKWQFFITTNSLAY